jgi:hypothetical protein
MDLRNRMATSGQWGSFLGGATCICVHSDTGRQTPRKAGRRKIADNFLPNRKEHRTRQEAKRCELDLFTMIVTLMIVTPRAEGACCCRPRSARGKNRPRSTAITIMSARAWDWASSSASRDRLASSGTQLRLEATSRTTLSSRFPT